ncbi:MAG: hypothetical protein LBN02_08965 [Oscillospiraceae bacterium]|jgi:hypothetical protein|nr:hypothetical protein [Oscillospiraceae bacterium]
MPKDWKKLLLYVLIIVVVAGVAVYFGILAGKSFGAGSAGSQTDPLITRTYLEEQFKPELETAINDLVNARVREIERSIDDKISAGISGSADYEMSLAELYKGQVLKLSEGAEVIFTSGGGEVALGALTDVTDGFDDILTIVLLHKYVAGTGGGAVAVTTDTAEAVVRGEYSVVG